MSGTAPAIANPKKLGQIEGKSPNFHLPKGAAPEAQANAAARSAINQVAHYTQTIRQLYRYVEVVAVSDLLETRIGTITTPGRALRGVEVDGVR